MTSALRVFVRRLLLALRYSWQGLREGWRTQASLRYEITAAFLILPNLVADYAKWGLGWRRLIEHDRLRDVLAAC